MAVKILLVEDDRDDALFVEDLLSEGNRARYALITRYTYAEGMEALRSNGRFDVVLLDYKLPDGDGLKFLAEMQRLRYDYPVVIITSHGDRNLQIQAMEAGACEYLEKGGITQDNLERTCLYAIGLHEKKTHNGSGPGVNVLVEQLVALNRMSVEAQINMANELKGVREGLGSTAKATDCVQCRNLIKESHTTAMSEIGKLSKFRWLLDWIAAHPKTAVLVFVLLVLTAVTVTVLLQFVDAQQLLEIKKATGQTAVVSLFPGVT